MARPPARRKARISRSRQRVAYRVALCWGETILDVVSIKGERGELSLRTGERIGVGFEGDEVVVDGDVRGRLGELVPLPQGHALIATRAAEEQRAGGLMAVDSTMFHATMVGAAVQACLVSALVLAPQPVPDTEGAGGVPTELRRLLSSPGGTAPKQGAPSIAMVGKAPTEAERVAPVRKKGGALPRGKGVTLEDALEEMRRALTPGDRGVELKDALGELARSVASAPQLGAGVGGLSPKDPQNGGVGNGLIAAGESQRMREVLQERIRDADRRRDDDLRRRLERPIGPVQLLDVPIAQVTLDEQADVLDPIVRDQIARAVKRRHGTVRYCYESWGLAADPHRSGRLVLELTLRPDGHVAQPAVRVDRPELALVGECVQKMAADWFLGDGLVEENKRLSFPFILAPRTDVGLGDDDEDE